MRRYGFTIFPRRIFMRPWRSDVPIPFLIAGGAGALIVSFYFGPRLFSVFGMVNSLIISTVAAILLYCGTLALAFPRGELAQKAGFAKVTLKDLRLCALSLPVMLAGTALITGAAGEMLDFFQINYEKEQALLQLVRRSDTSSFLKLLLLTAGVIPLLEELVFRRGLYALLLKLGAPAAMVGTALIFSAAHGFLLGAPGLFFIGVVFQMVCNMTRNLWCSVISHALLNATVLAVTFAAGKAGAV